MAGGGGPNTPPGAGRDVDPWLGPWSASKGPCREAGPPALPGQCQRYRDNPGLQAQHRPVGGDLLPVLQGP